MWFEHTRWVKAVVLLELFFFYNKDETKITVFKDVMLCSLVDRCSLSRGICCFQHNFSFLKLKSVHSSELLILIYHTIWHHIAEDWPPQKSYTSQRSGVLFCLYLYYIILHLMACTFTVYSLYWYFNSGVFHI
jgi:hypothetical protein